MNVLVIDIGGSHVKLSVTGVAQSRRFKSGRMLTPHRFVQEVLAATADWRYDVVSIGFPGVVAGSAPGGEPGHLGSGWVGFDFEKAVGRPVRLVNDAVMQALGTYDGGRMLFLGLGTGLGSALVSEHVVIPLELGNLPAPRGGTMGDRVGRKALEQSGRESWVADVHDITVVLRDALVAEYVVLGGGNAKVVDPLPPLARRGGNEDAFTGGFRLWEEVVEPHSREPQRVWRVVQ
jgi:predicted NBD/HSP70 family sugar kinase